MRNTQSITEAVNAVAIATAAATLTNPPTTGQMSAVPAEWTSSVGAVVPEVELAIWAAVSVALTAAQLYAAAQHALTFATKTVVPDHTSNSFALTAHGLLTGDGPVDYAAATTPPTGLDPTQQFYVIKTSANAFQLATTLANALAGTPITFTDNGTGAQTVLADNGETPPNGESMRLAWGPVGGKLGVAGDGAVALAAGEGYVARFVNSPLYVAYALVGTLDTGALNASVYPIRERG